ncbi:hypothetical protein MASR2M78_16920 [Treponema sp.]
MGIKHQIQREWRGIEGEQGWRWAFRMERPWLPIASDTAIESMRQPLKGFLLRDEIGARQTELPVHIYRERRGIEFIFGTRDEAREHLPD